MIVVVDIGNSSIKVAATVLNPQKTMEIEKVEIGSVMRLSARPDRTPDELFVELKTLGITEPRDAVICSVVPELTERFLLMFRNRFNIGHPLVVSPYVNTGITIHYRNFANLGPDRVANAVAAYFEYGRNVAVVDFGTATTIDFVTGGGEFLGGIIAPGLEQSLAHLVSSTARLIPIKPARPERFLGRSTEECMQSGFYLLTVGLVEAARAAVRKETGEDFTFVATGGLAGKFSPFSAAIEIIDHNLTLKGCVHLYRLNKRGKITGTGDEGS